MMAGPATFHAITQEGFDDRMAYAKGLLVASQVVTTLDSDFTSWTTVEIALSQDFTGGGDGGSRLTEVLLPAVELAKANMQMATGSATWPSPAAA